MRTRIRVLTHTNSSRTVKDIKTGGIPNFLLAEAEWTNSKLGTSYHPKLEATTLLNSIKEITIVDSKGITYIFGGDIESIDFSFVYMQDPEYPKYYNMYGKQIGQHNAVWDDFNSFMVATPLTWHIKKIILPNKEDLKFSYSKSNINVMERFDHHAIVASRHTGERIYSTTNNPNNTLLPEGVDPRYIFQIDKKYDISYPSLLESIYASNGDSIKFISSKRSDLTIHGVYFENKIFLRDNYGGVLSNIEDRCYYYKLDKIETKGGICKFYYTDKNEQRLKLDSLLIDKIEKYKFQYNPLPLPPHSKMLTDNWGYYNKKDYSQIVRNGIFHELYNARKPDSTFVKAEILEKITYPTGGKVHLQYELHDYSKIATQYPFEIKQESGVAGGVRIKRITVSNDEYPSENITKDYLYLNEDNTSSGILSVVPKYETSGSGRIDYDHGGISMHGEYNYSNKTSTHINWIDKFHISYSRIIEVLSDQSKTIFSFVNHDQVKDEPSVGALCLEIKDDLYNKYTLRELDRGLLKSIKQYTTSNKLLKEETFTYHSDLTDYLKTINRYALMNSLPTRVSANKIYTYYPYLKKKTSTLYLDKGNIVETEEYKYNKYKLLTQTTKSINGSNNDIYETRTKYLIDLMEEYTTPIANNSPLKVYDNMRAKYMFDYPIEQIQIRNQYLVGSKLFTYMENEKNDDYVLNKIYQSQLNVPILYRDFINFNGNIKDSHYGNPEIEYTKYNSNSNVEETTSKGSYKTTYIWGYNELYPVAKFENAQNSYKIVSQEQDARIWESIALQYSPLSNNQKTYNFQTSRSGNIEFHLSGAMGDNWYVTGMLDGNRPVNLVSIRSSVDAGRPWSDYRNAYTYNATFDIPAGQHTFIIYATAAYKGTAANDNGQFRYTYWGKENIAPEITGTDDVFYENFENTFGAIIPFGFHSSKSYADPYTISLASTPSRRYLIDYQIFKDGKWNYIKSNFENGTHTIDEGSHPIDDIRVYPKDANVTSFNYIPFVGLRSKTDVRGITESYQYNSLNKLQSTIDTESNPLERYDYHYQNQSHTVVPESFFNIKLERDFTRSNCNTSLGEIGKKIAYVVPAGKHTSTISQEDANRIALEDIATNGQRYANENGECGQYVIVSVYNPHSVAYSLECIWGVNGSIRSDYYHVDPSKRIADTGDILNDFKPTILYIPRKYYRNISMYIYGQPQEYVDFSRRSSIENPNFIYTIDQYPKAEDTYVVGFYLFPL